MDIQIGRLDTSQNVTDKGTDHISKIDLKDGITCGIKAKKVQIKTEL